MHYSRWLTHGNPEIVIRQMKSPCSVDGCEKNARAHGYCSKHLVRWQKHGDPLFEAPILGRPLKSEVLSYTGVHKRLERQRGAATNFRCVDCGEGAREWSYDGRDTSEHFDIVRGSRVAYSLALEHYEPRCVSCHRKHDGAGNRGRNANGSFATRGERSLAGMGQ